MPRAADSPEGSRRTTTRRHGVATGSPSAWRRWLQDHTRALDTAVTRLKRHSFGTMLTLLVIGIVLALPATLTGVLHDVSGGGYQLGQKSLQATLFLKDSVSQTDGETLARRIARRPGVAAAHYLSRSDALAEFKRNSGAAAALDALVDNPLPASITVTPDVHASEGVTRKLMQSLATLPQVDQAQLNQQWLQRLYAIFRLASHVVTLIMAALAVTVLIVIGNTIRLEIEDRRDEIAITKLIGASNAYVRRPFLYGGACYGLAGAVVALILVSIGLALLQSSVRDVAALYGAHIDLPGLGFESAMTLLGVGLVLGWAAAFWTVSRHLHRIEPR
ncbi:MAG TPA: permease-like cell division protein FtsX [Nevskiaceae bacterium]|nr:permease-like cell division protein FtsX [Nevskiaceae bacterium]